MDHASTPANPTSPAAPANCPRCGYDQHGTIDTWTDSCPTRGTCSECGLDFDWADILNPYRGKLKGLLEHAKGITQLFRWTLITFSWMLLPHRFWTKVQMHHRVRLWPIAAAGLLFTLLAHTVAGLCGVTVNYATAQFTWQADNLNMWWPRALSPFLEPHVSISTWSAGAGRISYWFEYPILRSIVRISALTTCMLAWPALFLVLPTTRRHGKLRWAHVWRAGVYPFLWIVLMLILDRVIGIGDFSLELLARFVSPASMYAFMEPVYPVVMFFSNAVWVAAPLWLTAWWYFAITRGWKLDHGRLIWLLLCIAGFAASALIATGIWYLRETGRLGY